ncbi:MAG: hypothetical protein ACYDBB_16615 [Armatimonadota bacterium]
MCHGTFVLVLLACSMLACAAAPSNRAAGMASGVRGVVKVHKAAGGALKALALMDLVLPGDTLYVAKHASVTVLLFSDGHREMISAGSSARIQAGNCRILQGSKTTLPVIKKAQTIRQSRAAIETFSGGIVVRGGALSDKIIPLSPVGGNMLCRRPVFLWSPVARAVEYAVCVWDDQGHELWRQDAIKGTSLPFPADQSACTPGKKYLWGVRALADGKMLVEATASFSLAADDRFSAARHDTEGIVLPPDDSTDATPYLLAAAVYHTHQLQADAIQIYQRLALTSNQAPFLHETLSVLYRMTGELDAANYEIWCTEQAKANLAKKDGTR